MDNSIPFSEASERNKGPILDVLKNYIYKGHDILEIGHGTGQHALHFANKLQAHWLPADLKENNWMMQAQLKLTPDQFIAPPIPMKAGEVPLKEQTNKIFDGVFTANTLHIMSEQEAITLCTEVGELIKEKGKLFFYGPFKFAGKFTSSSNENFDLWLKNRDPNSGIRDFEVLQTRLENGGLQFHKRYDLPANNQLLIFKKN